ncbi:MAG TPA: S8 family serine peptidase [Pyrinomonadaceae bacterium]
MSNPKEVLDTSDEGGPFIPSAATPAPPDSGIDPPDNMAGPPSLEGDLIVEVELAPGIVDLDHAMIANIDTLGSEATTPQESAFATTLRTHGILEARQVYTREQTESDDARIKALREEIDLEPGPGPSPRIKQVEQLSPLSKFIRLRFPSGTSATKVVNSLKERPEVVRVAIVPRVAPPTLPVDPLIGANDSSVAVNAAGLEPQWYLHRTRVPQAWQHTRGGGVVIADVDWGCRISHQELDSAIERTYNAFDGTNNVSSGPDIAHGTAVLGIAGARADSTGVAGYAPESNLWAIQGDNGTGALMFDEPWAEGIDFANRTPADGRRKVILVEVQSFSGGNIEQLPSVHRAIRAAIANRCVVCVAAGNGNRRVDVSDTNQPIDDTGSILVGATGFNAEENRRAFFSNHGDRIAVSAPGDLDHDVTCSGRDDNRYRNRFGGTSGAAAKVAGTIALMLSVNPNLSHEDVREILVTTGSPVTEDPGRPIGTFLNAEAAVEEAIRRLP